MTRFWIICFAALCASYCSADSDETSVAEQDDLYFQGSNLQGTSLQGSNLQGMSTLGAHAHHILWTSSWLRSPAADEHVQAPPGVNARSLTASGRMLHPDAPCGTATVRGATQSTVSPYESAETMREPSVAASAAVRPESRLRHARKARLAYLPKPSAALCCTQRKHASPILSGALVAPFRHCMQ
jgi:hypothetical protein